MEPLHPLPIPNDRGDSVAMDFIRLLPIDENFDCILSMTNRLGSDIRIVPTRMDITAEDLALLFFNHWYCENGLLKDIVSDRDKLFVSKFWRALHKLTGVKLKLSSGYHPEMDRSSERSNKTINQCIRYHVCRNQKGWVHTLPRICFDIMNSVNASIGFSNFQIRLGRSPRLIPPLVPGTIEGPVSNEMDAMHVQKLIENIEIDMAEAKDNLFQVKISKCIMRTREGRWKSPLKLVTRLCCRHYTVIKNLRRRVKKEQSSFSPAMMNLMILLTCM